MKIIKTIVEDSEILKIAESLLISWAMELSVGNLTNKSRYDYLIESFSKADLNSGRINDLKIFINSYLKNQSENNN